MLARRLGAGAGLTQPDNHVLLSVSHGRIFGGVENQMMRLSGPLRERGWRTVAVLPEGPGNATERLADAGVEVVTLPLGRLQAIPRPSVQARFAASLRRDVRALRRLIRELGADVVQVHGVTNPQGAMAAHREGVPVVWQLLDTRAPMALRRAAMPFVRRLADTAMTTGLLVADAHPGARALGDRLVPYYPPVVVDAFAAEDRVREQARSELALPSWATAVGTVGNLNPQKGHEDLIRALASTRGEHPEARLRLLGAVGSAHPGRAESLAALAHELRVGEPDEPLIVDPGTRVPELLPAFDVFVLSSVRRSEGVPTAVIEAMACGIPVVTTDVGAVREVVVDGRSGLIVEPESPKALGEALARLLGDSELRRAMGREGRKRAVERFGIDRCVEAHLTAYERALARSGDANGLSRQAVPA
jgi:glycosyltransferase involved in cell wall biosynthesis